MSSDLGSLSFPDVPKLELDELIDQLVERAEGVRRAQGVLRSLLRAIGSVTAVVSLDQVLHNIAEAAASLGGARYGALAVVDDTGLDQFVRAGAGAGDDAIAATIAALPRDAGPLGDVLAERRPVRARAEDTDLPTSFLGVPVLIGEKIFGALYVAGAQHGSFTADDEELLVALATAAGTAVGHARLLAEARVQQRWLSATVEIGAQLLSDIGEDPLRLIARHAKEIAEADLVVVGLLTEDAGTTVIEQGCGLGADGLIGRRFPLDQTVAGIAVAQRRALLLAQPDDVVVTGRSQHLTTVIDAGPTMILPLDGADGVRGFLTIVRVRNSPRFSELDLQMAVGFAAHASVALELADSRIAEQRVVLLEDRDRIARDLHDHVIQELFAIGLSLQSVAAELGPDSSAGARIGQRIEDIDRTIRRIRTSIFELRSAASAVAVRGLRSTILDIVSDLTPALGFAPHVGFSGLVDHLEDPALVDDITAVIREALTNVAKHAQATRVDVDVDVSPATVGIGVSDNGIGVGDATRSSGTANLRARAERRGGQSVLLPAPGGGTLMLWKIPNPS